MAYARITRFTGATPEQIATVVSGVEEAGGPPPGVKSTGLKLVVNEDEGTVIFIGFFDSEDDLMASDAALREMDPPGGVPGTRASVDMGEIRVERES
jgi:hypothetical protein